MIKFKGEVFMMKFVACAEKSETHSIIYLNPAKFT